MNKTVFTLLLVLLALGCSLAEPEPTRDPADGYSFDVTGVTRLFFPSNIDPEPGTRFVAVKVRIANVKSGESHRSSYNRLTLIDDLGNAYPPVVEAAAGIEEPLNEVFLNDGQKADGWIVFSIPFDAEPVKVQYRFEPRVVLEDTLPE